jgi:hypothetical protein
MPVIAKLSRKFYERFGHELTNELVEWFNLVDATYRGDLRELNELNFARFDAKLEQRISQLDAKIEQRTAELRAEIEQRFGQLDAKLEQRTAELRAEMQVGFARLDNRIERGLGALETRLTRRLFGFWIAQSATTVGLVFGVLKLLQA